MKTSKNKTVKTVETVELAVSEIETSEIEVGTSEVVVRKHRQNRNTLAALLRSRTKILWPSNKGTYNVGRNKAKRDAKLKSI